MTRLADMSTTELTDYYSRCHKRALGYEMRAWYKLADAEHARMSEAKAELEARGMRVR